MATQHAIPAAGSEDTTPVIVPPVHSEAAWHSECKGGILIDKFGFTTTWSMAVGGMVGGGIYTVLGVVLGIAGPWFWLSFLVAGLIAWVSAYAYSSLAQTFGEGGGAFTFLREIDREGLAGSLSWVLIIGYVLTVSVYAFTFGHYVAFALGGSALVARLAALAIVGVLVALNLRGTGQAAIAEIVMVWSGIAILTALAVGGAWRGSWPNLFQGVPASGPGAAVLGAGAVFMAYEGFQLLSYDYEDIENPDRNLPRGLLLAVPAVMLVYIVVATGATMVVGAGDMVANADAALAIAGREVAGYAGVLIVTAAAAFSTGSAINSTLFATARLARTVAEDDELPAAFAHQNERGIPDRAVIALGAVAALLAAVGNLGSLVEAASLAFLATFTVVNGLAAWKHAEARWLHVLGTAAAAAATAALGYRLAVHAPFVLLVLGGMILLAVAGRPLILRNVRTV